jgi:AcrR family transcriptional regulator/acyl-coenzyme A thioesterase PaaI-like protein
MTKGANSVIAESAINRLLGIRIDRATGTHAVARLKIENEFLGPSGAIDAAILSAVGSAAIFAGARTKEKSTAVQTTEVQARHYVIGSGTEVVVDARRIAVNQTHETWRAEVCRGDKGVRPGVRSRIAEVTQTFQLVPKDVSSDPISVQDQFDETTKSTSELAVDSIGTSLDSKLTVVEKRKRQIFEGACEVILEKGYGGSSIREIAKAAKIPVPTMYQYIKTKEDILFMITSGCMEEIFHHFRDNLEYEKSAIAKMENAVRSYVAYISKNRRYINLVYRETRSLNPDNRERIFDIEREFTDLWQGIIEEGNKTKEFKSENPALSAAFIYFFCNVWALRHWAIDEYNEEEVADLLIIFVINGLTSP